MTDPRKDPRYGSCICGPPKRRDDGTYDWSNIRSDCGYHTVAAENPDDHRIPWNCPTYWDGCNCKERTRDDS